MKRFFILLALFALFIGQKGFCADDMMDIDYQFIDNAFSKPNPTTNKQFEEVMKQYENKEPRGFFYKIRKFFNKNNPAFDNDFKKKYEGANNQPSRLKDAPESKPTITIGANFYDSKGKLLQAGHYQVEYKKESDNFTISLLQGNTRVADIKAILYEDDWDTPVVVYTRVQNVRDDLVRIIYSNLDITLQGYIKLQLH